ncbi:Hydantoinase/oxoprolinase-domain-containing protein [Schizophyllum amplum]|uniref:Hydantoinase/oxoprolinase-domain-containing protein n=1 Tax=Schizophyllum amplum TaxID=97359 RepID=A0A550C058_9AGAR|nr:Hydantoinase/oxoprolinase-domain-containing protein [Auriculariopsis ampla]
MTTYATRIPAHSIRIAADRGGTFCDVHASYPDPDSPGQRKEMIVKLLSQDPANYRDAPTEGIRRVLNALVRQYPADTSLASLPTDTSSTHGGDPIPRATPLPTALIASIRLSTTVATNALLERRGERHALLVTKGFKDALLIGNQARPKIFDLNIRRPAPLYDHVIEIDERVTVVGYSSDPRAAERAVIFDDNGKVIRGYDGQAYEEPSGVEGDLPGPGSIVRGISGDAVLVYKTPDEAAVKKQLKELKDQGYRSIAILLAHSWTYPAHEQAIAKWAAEAGFPHISPSAELLAAVKMVPRGASASADAYLTPVLGAYLDGFFAGFEDADNLRKSGRVEFMTSTGGLVPAASFSGLKSILSGPAGGVVGYARTCYGGEDEGGKARGVIGLDVGGTSTDVSRYAGRYEVVQEAMTAGISVVGGQLDINTVAAGGGSCLEFRNGMFCAGPASAGAEPGPVCYRKGGPLALTDANLVLGRLVPAYFPAIFGPGENEGPDAEAAKAALEKVREAINADPSTERPLSLDEVAYGFVKVANETMCRPIRALTEARGYATGEHILAPFGGAGGQHACEIASLLGIKTVLVHRYSSVLSAYGLALAERVVERQEPASDTFSVRSAPGLAQRLARMEEAVKKDLEEQGFPPDRINVERLLNMRFDGTDTALMVLGADARGEEAVAGIEDFAAAFGRAYKSEFGFLLEGKAIVVDDVKVRGIGTTYDTLGENVHIEAKRLTSTEGAMRRVAKEDADTTHSVYFEKLGRVLDTPIYLLEKLRTGDEVAGPAVVIDDTQTIVLVPGARALVTSRHLWIEVE